MIPFRHRTVYVSFVKSYVNSYIARFRIYYFTTVAANLAISLKSPYLHAARVNVSRNAFFSSHSEKIIFFDVDIVLNNKSKCGSSWSVLLLTTSTRHYSFPKHFFVLFLHVERFCKSFRKESLTRKSSSFA